MTSDAKIGLLLGLIFIFVIAFIINGLPRFRSVANSSELTTNMVSTPNGTLGIGINERHVQEDFDRSAPAIEQPIATVQRPFEQKEDIRFKMKLPQDTFVATETAILEPPDQVEPAESPSAESIAPAVSTPAAPPEEKTEVSKPKPAAPQVYTVCENDTLGDISKKVYGEEEGNKYANVMRIFQANRHLLKAPDEIYVGQKLTIPAPQASGTEVNKNDGFLSGSMFEKVISIGKKHLLPESSSTPSAGSGSGTTTGPKPVKGQPAIRKTAKPAGEYVVKEGDYLWRIAAQQLGDGNRYLEIAKLNADQLKDQDTLSVGMRLKMPAK
jgi:nucleoid-associated protein YgaU